jgi:hypothetical protein
LKRAVVDIEKIVTEVKRERNRLSRAIASLEGTDSPKAARRNRTPRRPWELEAQEDRAGFLKVVGDTHMSAKRAKSSDSSKKPSISAKIRCTLTPQGQRNQIKKGKSGRKLQEIDIQIKAEDIDLFEVDEDGNLSFMLALAPLDDLPEKSEVIRLVQEAIEKKKSATALHEQEDE